MRFTSFLFAFIALVACKNGSTSKEEVNYTSHMNSLATPIHLQLKETRVNMADYFPEWKNIERITLEGTELKLDSAGFITIAQSPNQPLSSLHVVYKNIGHDIPVFSSEKMAYTFSYKASNAKVKSVSISGSINGWNNKANPLTLKDGLWVTDLELNPGTYQYRIWEDANEMMDANNPFIISNGMGGFNNTFTVGNPKAIAPQLTTLEASETGLKLLSSSKLAHVYAYFQNERIDVKTIDSLLVIDLPAKAKNLDRSFIRVYADNGELRSNDILIPLTHGDVVMNASSLNRKDLHASIMYFAMVDRFNDGDASNNHPTTASHPVFSVPILPKANNLGGDLKGITKKIQEGYFSKLGINTIWISPISQNTEGAWGLWIKGQTSSFSAYHGYWPTALTRIDRRLGNEADFKELIDVAHANNMNVVLDYVAHHVHEEHPLYKQKPDWTTPLYLPDGTMNTEKWDEHRLTTWFDTFLPTWDFSKPEVVDALTDTAMYWVKNYDLDGFRHDATKHIREEFWRSLTQKVRTQAPDKTIFQIGETYGSPELISSYLSTGMMDAQFDFNLYDAAVDAFAKSESGFENLHRVLNESMHYYGHHHLMGNITGNQDRARFTSYADGGVKFDEDPKLAGWTRDIQNNGKVGFERMEMLNAFLMTTPGIPCIYYGDEIGMPGGNDPDNRRMMVFSGWNNEQSQLQKAISQLTTLRRSSMALTYGDLLVLQNDEKVFAYVRQYFGEAVVVVFSKKGNQGALRFTLPQHLHTEAWKSMKGSAFSVKGNSLTVDLKSSPYEVIYPTK